MMPVNLYFTREAVYLHVSAEFMGILGMNVSF